MHGVCGMGKRSPMMAIWLADQPVWWDYFRIIISGPFVLYVYFDVPHELSLELMSAGTIGGMS